MKAENRFTFRRSWAYLTHAATHFASRDADFAAMGEFVLLKAARDKNAALPAIPQRAKRISVRKEGCHDESNLFFEEAAAGCDLGCLWLGL